MLCSRQVRRVALAARRLSRAQHRPVLMLQGRMRSPVVAVVVGSRRVALAVRVAAALVT